MLGIRPANYCFYRTAFCPGRMEKVLELASVRDGEGRKWFAFKGNVGASKKIKKTGNSKVDREGRKSEESREGRRFEESREGRKFEEDRECREAEESGGGRKFKEG